LRYYGLTELQRILRSHIDYAIWLEEVIIDHPDYELLTPRNMNLVCFRWKPNLTTSSDELNQLNQTLMTQLNNTGQIYLTHTKVRDDMALRISIGQLNVTLDHVKESWELIKRSADSLKAKI